MKNTISITGILVVFLFTMSCERSTTVNRTNSSFDQVNNPIPTPNPTPNPGDPYILPNPTPIPDPNPSNCANGSADAAGVSDAGQSIDYYKLNNPSVVAHGASGGQIVWSSETDLPSSYNQNIFFSDSRMNIRVVPRYQNQGVDSKGVTCAYVPQPFTKMNIGVVVRSASAQPGVGAYYQFKDVDVNCPSKVREFQVPASQDPLIIEVMNVQWDWSCLSYAQQGYNNVPGYCPYANVWQTECYQLEIQFATDTTKNLPGPRAN